MASLEGWSASSRPDTEIGQEFLNLGKYPVPSLPRSTEKLINGKEK